MDKIKIKLVKASKKLINLGLNIGSEGNISYRLGENVFITPSGIDAFNLDKKKIAVVDLDGKRKNEKRPSSELSMHLSIYQDRPEIKSIVHCHSSWATILSCLRINIPSFHYMIAEFGGDNIKCSKYATFGSKKLANFVLNVIKERKGCLISNHGQLTISDSIGGAIHLACALEKLSKQYYFCYLTRKTKLLKNSEMLEVVKLFKSYKSKH